MTSFGHGPWFVALIEDSSHPGATEIFIHTYPENVVHVKNLQLCQQWFIHFYVGPFSHLQHCLSYCNQWNKSKQLKTRIDQGQKLFNEQKTKQNLYVYKAEVAAATAATPATSKRENCEYTTIEQIKTIANKRTC